MELLTSTSFTLSILSAIFFTIMFIYYQRSVHKEKYVKTPLFYSAIFFVSACLFHSIFTNFTNTSDMKLKNVFKISPIDMKTGAPPF